MVRRRFTLHALPHIPNRLMKDMYTGAGAILVDQAKLLFMGCVFCWLYLRTRNLLFLVGTHALVNRPTMLLAMPERFAPAAGVACLFAALLIALLWRQPVETNGATSAACLSRTGGLTPPRGTP